MPPCRKVLLNKINRTDHLAQIIKNANNDTISESGDGWYINENGIMEIEYFDGDQFPDNVTQITEKNEEDSEIELGSSDEESDSDDCEENEDFFV